MGRPFVPFERECCRRCGLEMAYMPLGKMCLDHGYERPWFPRLLKTMGVFAVVYVAYVWLVFLWLGD